VLLIKYIIDLKNGNNTEVESAGWGAEKTYSDKLIQL
jgi:hypothetical protein